MTEGLKSFFLKGYEKIDDKNQGTRTQFTIVTDVPSSDSFYDVLR
jgi:hypothetical protein